MEVLGSKSLDSLQPVRVAVNIRPFITTELVDGCTSCITIVKGEPQVVVDSHKFTYDYVYDNNGSSPSSIYEDCIAPLVDALFHGYNATVLAYGQIGSGKIYTMGTNYNGNDINNGIIPKVMDDIYKRVEVMRNSMEFLIRVSFIEIFKEEVFDLLGSNISAISTGEGDLNTHFVPKRSLIQIRETSNGRITLVGLTEAKVRTKEDMASYLSRGSLSRLTESTSMNSQSSRSHAIFTITMEQTKNFGSLPGVSRDDVLCAKLHLVDLAGSERVKRARVDGLQFKDGIHINKGLLALCNVISALGDEKKRKDRGHVPYRDSKLTRLLQVKCNPTIYQTQRMQSQIEELQSKKVPYVEIQVLKRKVSILEANYAELQRQVLECQRAIDAQVEKEKLDMEIELARCSKSGDEDGDLIQKFVSKPQEIELEIQRVRNTNGSKKKRFRDCMDTNKDKENYKNVFLPPSDHPSNFETKSGDFPDEIEDHEKELEHSSIQEKFDEEHKEIDKKLEPNEDSTPFMNRSMKRLEFNYDSDIQVIRSTKILFEDLDTTESKCSENDFTSDEDWVDPIKHQVGKENANLVSSNRGASRKDVNLASSTASGLCCSCSSMSTCKTMKCHCRGNGGLCGSTCRCIVAKCTNQEKKCELDMPSQI